MDILQGTTIKFSGNIKKNNEVIQDVSTLTIKAVLLDTNNKKIKSYDSLLGTITISNNIFYFIIDSNTTRRLLGKYNLEMAIIDSNSNTVVGRASSFINIKESYIFDSKAC